MSLTCPVGLDAKVLREEIRKIYSRVAIEPTGDFHFHRGAEYAAVFLGYDPRELAGLPADCTASFAGIGNPHAIQRIQKGEIVLDLGCGAGMDLLLAAQRTGPDGKAIGIDMTEEMVNRARSSAAAAGFGQVEVRRGDATMLPVEDETIDVVISNGALNLVPEKERALSEILRVLRPGGRLQLADIALDTPLTEDVRGNKDLWAA